MAVMDPDFPHESSADRSMAAIGLHGAYIGSVISFDWSFPTGVTRARVTGELRQVYHTAHSTVLNLCSATVDTAGETDEFVLLPGQMVTIES
jgi:hypothetical protein